MGIMQPYLFPYIGYFQLINAVDKFLIYDNVTFIKQGWINRNNILVNGKPLLFSVPLHNLSSYTLIRNTEINKNSYCKWKDKTYKTLEQNYKKAPFYKETLALAVSVFELNPVYISTLASQSIKMVCAYLSIPTVIINSAVKYNNDHLKAFNRVIDTCSQEKADSYINTSGGTHLYSKDVFKNNGIDLYFIKTNAISYKQFDKPFVPNLSILDVLMFNSIDETKNLLLSCELI
jgi:hypothetical protein